MLRVFRAPSNWSRCSLAVAANVLFLLFLGSCGSQPLGEDWPTHKIAVGAGPEDLLLDTFSGPPRLLVSCDARRKNEPPAAGIWALDLTTKTAKELPRIGEPEYLIFHPHGIDLREPGPQPRSGVSSDAPQGSDASSTRLLSDAGNTFAPDSTGDGNSAEVAGLARPVLYVISHDDDRNIHSVLAYLVFPDHLEYLRSWTDPLLNSPNAVCALADGSLLVTNDSGKRGNSLEALLKRKKSTVVAWSAKTGRWGVAAGELAYANGITSRGEGVYVATTRQNRIFQYQWDGEKLFGQRELATVHGADNLRWDEDDLLVAGHPNILAFVRHASSAKRKSPVQVWPVKPTVAGEGAESNSFGAQPINHPAVLIYATDGKPISAAATALTYQGKLYLSQVFDSFVLEVLLPEE